MHALARTRGENYDVHKQRKIQLDAAYRGNSEKPIRDSSTARAHWRPSRIAHTTSDWPRRMSPAAKTLGTEVT
jgi:hypothetical protein